MSRLWVWLALLLFAVLIGLLAGLGVSNDPVPQPWEGVAPRT
jgi:hypothetical protein